MPDKFTITETRLTAAAAIRADIIAREVEEYCYSHPELFGHDPAQMSGARGLELRKYCSDEVLDALYAEYDALPRESYEVEMSDASYEEF